MSRIDNIIAARRQQVVETHESFRSMSERLLWTMMRPMPLKYLVESVTSGPRGWGDFVADSGRPFIRIANLSPLGIDLRLENLVKVDPPSGAEVERASVRRGDVLLSITATMGSVGIVESTEEATFSQHVGRIRPSSMGDSRWIAWVLQSRSMLDHFSLNAYGGGKVGLGLDQIRNLPVPTVVPLRRTEISTAIDRAWSITESGVSGLERSVKLLAEYKQSLITAAVTGEFDVTTARKGIAT